MVTAETYLQVNLSCVKCALKYSIQRNVCATPDGQERNYNHMSRSLSAPFDKTKESDDLYYFFEVECNYKYIS